MRSPTRGSNVPEPSAVEIGRDAMLTGGRADPLRLVLGKDHPSGTVVRVLHFDERGWRVEYMAARLARSEKLLGSEYSPSANFRELDSGVGGRTTGLVPDRVTLAAYDYVIARTSEDAQCHLIRHGSTWKPKRRLLAEEHGNPIL